MSSEKIFTSNANKHFFLFSQQMTRLHLSRRRWLSEKKQTAASVIQASYRRHKQRNHFLSLGRSSVTVQKAFRRWIALRKFQCTQNEIVLLQTLARRFLAVREYKRRQEQVSSRIIIQAHGRRFLTRVRFHKTKSAAVRVQAMMRQKLESKRFNLGRTAVTTLQAYARRNKLQHSYRHIRRSVLLMQALVRRYLVLTSTQRQLKSVIVAQSISRRWLSRRMASQLRALEKNEHLSATLVQASWRSYSKRTLYRRMRSNASIIQRFTRAVLRQNFGARALQKVFRAYLVRRELSVLRENAVIIQRTFRGFSSWLSYEMSRMDIIVVQSIVRKWLVKRNAVQLQSSVTVIQSAARQWLACRKLEQLIVQRDETILREKCAVVIQRVFRGSVSRERSGKDAAARKIQKTWRCYTVHVDYMLSIIASISIQASFRGFRSRRLCEKRQTSVMTLQCFGRRVLRRIRESLLERAAMKIQSLFRMSLCRSRFLLSRIAAVVIQRRARGIITRESLTIGRHAATAIQRVWRGYSAFANRVIMILSAIKIQSHVRAYLARLNADLRRAEKQAQSLLQERSARKIQLCYRDFVFRRSCALAASKIVRVARKFLFSLAATKLRRGALRAQAVARGYLTRKRMSRRLRSRALRISKANENALREPKLLLGNRARAALDVLRKSTRLAEIHTAICTLEIATRLSEVCCSTFAEAHACDILFSLIRNCNRSLPHVELLHNILLTLSNVAQYDSLLPSMMDTEGVEILLDLVQMFRDKDGVFFLAATLLERFLQIDREFQVRNSMTHASACRCVHSAVIPNTFTAVRL